MQGLPVGDAGWLWSLARGVIKAKLRPNGAHSAPSSAPELSFGKTILPSRPAGFCIAGFKTKSSNLTPIVSPVAQMWLP